MTPISAESVLSAAADIRNPHYQELKGRVHQELLGRLNLERLTRVKREDAEPEIRSLIIGLLERESQSMPLSLFERDALITDVLHEIFGLGPLEALLKDPDISDILVNRHNQVYIERDGRLEESEIVFQNDAHLFRIIERIVSMVGRRIDESSPMVDARLRDGSRVNAIIPRRWRSTARSCRFAASGPIASARRTSSIGSRSRSRCSIF
jgi:pilus assembly protein CpaF